MIVSLSKKVYSSKEEAKEELHKRDGDFVWSEVSLNPYELYEKILEGYCFSPASYKYLLELEVNNNRKLGKNGISVKNTKTGGTFYMNPFDNEGGIYKWARKKERWSEAQCMFVDIDGSEKSMEEYIKTLPLKPTFGFYTPSDRPEKRRFKLVYCFNQPVYDLGRWCYIAEYLTSRANNSGVELDPCGKKATQMSFQSNGNGEWFGYIIDLNLIDYSGLNEFLNEINKEDRIKDKFILDDNLVKYLNIWIKYRGKDYNKSIWAWKNICSYFDMSDLLIYNTTEELKDVPVYNPILMSEQNNIIKLTTKDYWELKSTPRKDGQHRRRTLYRRMLLRRILAELNGTKISPELLLVNAVIDRETFINNNDSEVSMNCLKDMVKDAWCKDLEKVKNSKVINYTIEYLKNEAPEFKFIGHRKDIKQYDLVSITLKYRGYLYQTILNYCFDSNKSVKENAENINKSLENKGWKIRISEKTIYKYKSSELKIQKDDRNSFIISKHKEGLSLSKINEELVENGYKSMSKPGIKKVIDKYNSLPNKSEESVEIIYEEPQEIIIDFSDYFKRWANL